MVFFLLQTLSASGEFIAGEEYHVERIHDSACGGQKLFAGCGIALESIHSYNAYLVSKCWASACKPRPQRISTAAFDYIKQPRWGRGIAVEGWSY
ncbi:hypothetical protein FHU42_000649 [Corynebacterium glutamicum]|nr:hypothetical protein [Corynebacterium glutamicum]